MTDYKIILLHSDHLRYEFDCGVCVLNDFFKKYALQNQKKRLVRTYICLKNDTDIVEFYLKYGFIPAPNNPLTLFFPLEFAAK